MSTLQLQNKYVWCWTLTTTLHATCCVVHKSHSFALSSNWILSPKFYISCLLKITLICFYFSSFFSNVLKVHICSKNILAIAFVLFLLLLLCNHLGLTELLVFPKTDEEYIDHVGCRCISEDIILALILWLWCIIFWGYCVDSWLLIERLVLYKQGSFSAVFAMLDADVYL